MSVSMRNLHCQEGWNGVIRAAVTRHPYDNDPYDGFAVHTPKALQPLAQGRGAAATLGLLA